MTRWRVQLSGTEFHSFSGVCLANVRALDHDDAVRRVFRLYRGESEYVAERIDYPGTLDVRYFGERCLNVLSVYQFFGTEPLANYLYGHAQLNVPGLYYEIQLS